MVSHAILFLDGRSSFNFIVGHLPGANQRHADPLPHGGPHIQVASRRRIGLCRNLYQFDNILEPRHDHHVHSLLPDRIHWASEEGNRKNLQAGTSAP